MADDYGVEKVKRDFGSVQAKVRLRCSLAGIVANAIVSKEVFYSDSEMRKTIAEQAWMIANEILNVEHKYQDICLATAGLK